jgi:hypothetical protein
MKGVLNFVGKKERNLLGNAVNYLKANENSL